MKNITIWFYDEYNKQNILFLITKHKEDAEKYISRHYKFNITINDSAEGGTFNREGFGIVIWLKEFRGTPKDYGILAHEITHACMMSFMGRGFMINEENDEPIAYQADYLMRKFLELFRKKRV